MSDEEIRKQEEELKRLQEEMDKEDAEMRQMEEEIRQQEEAIRIEEERLQKEIEEEERKAQEEDERLKEEEERVRLEAEQLQKEIEEEERRAKEEEERKAKEEEERKAKEEEERQAKEEEERQAKEEEERKAREEAERKAREEAERKAKELEEEEKIKLEEERKAKEEEERKAKELEEERKAKELEEEEKIKLEEERLRKENEEEERKMKEEEERLNKEAEKLQKELEAEEKEEKKDMLNIDLLCDGLPENPNVARRIKARGKTHVGKGGIYGNLKKEDMKTEYVEPEKKPTQPEVGKGFNITTNGGVKLPTKMNPLMAEVQARKAAKVGRASFSVKPSIITKPEPKKISPSTSPGLADDAFLAQQTFSNEVDGMNTSMNYEKMVRVSGKFFLKWRITELKPEYLNSGDVFIIDKIDKIYVWIGKDSSRLKRTKVCDAANTIKHDERQGRCEIIQVNQGKEDEEFWKALGGKNDNIAKAEPNQDDIEDKDYRDELYLLGEKKGSWDEAEVVNCSKGKIAHNTLLPWNVYVYDGGNDVYLWIGTRASSTLRKSAKVVAQQIFDKKQRSPIAQLIRITQQTEPVIFKEKFAVTQGSVETVHNPDCSYTEDELNQSRNRAATVSVSRPTKPLVKPVFNRNAPVEEEKMTFDIRELLGIPDDSIVLQPSKDFIIQGGTIKVYVICDIQKEAIPESMYGEFYSENDYIIDYKDPKEEVKFFYWQGKHTSIKSKGKTSMLVSDLSKKKGASTIRVPQGEEPHAFMQLFEDKYLIHIGNYFEREKHQATERIYQVSNTMFENTCEYTVQREFNKEFINSSCSYIYVNTDGVKIWKGKYANENNRRVAEEAAKRIDQRPATILDEKDGKVLFNEVKHFDNNYAVVMPKSYHLISEKMCIKVKQNTFFTCQRFKEPTLLTCEKGIYLLLTQLKKDCIMPYLNTVHEYLEKLNGKYCGIDVPEVYVIHSLKHIPKEVVTIIHGFEKSSLKEMDIENDPQNIISFKDLWNIINKKYTYEELLQRPIYLDKTKLETYLSDEEFVKVFKRSRSDYNKMKKFEKEQLKKQHKLF
ncbi:villidin putative [Entamoeba histolytica]|uniref:Villidin, putative n=3 Tax=Entamoeba histolytica TaxID=5759 RepID=C4M041_ENTH1|nr:villidin, putative [Entamoeba histolytica HM-1:IMSS]EAL49978.1 villidin, putative [Entamoeba histolytica HM-1:IMSS]ENY61210.1 villin headpiece domain containing protein [Entamoeba histolytica HM-1:IMSS-A]GAT94510.1 villidin putative [Entamoeba histolytica]|eukprot:XP_655365.1 villidin, putative [Entamoeba histolytica HM-1:IMSS]